MLLLFWAIGPGCTGPGSDAPAVTRDTVRDTARPTPDSALPFTGPVAPRVLMISIDTLRKDHIGRYSGSVDDMPTLTGLMGDSVTLDDHLTCSNWTFPGTTCTLLGALHEDRDFMPKISLEGRAPFPDGTPFLASLLQDAGWATAILSGNGWLSAEFNTVQGYGDGQADKEQGTTLQKLTDALQIARDFETAGARSWLVHVHVMEPHAPYSPPAEYLGGLDGLPEINWDLNTALGHYALAGAYPVLDEQTQATVEEHLRVRYRAELAFLDDNLRDGLAAWDDAGLLDDVLLVIWSDHGESRWEHGHLTHAFDLYAEENDGVALLHHRNLTPTAWDGPTHAIDLAPTLVDLFGVARSDEMTGHAIGTAPTERDRFALTIARNGGQSSVVRDHHKLFYEWSTGTVELYDRRTDPAEGTDLYAADHPMVQALWPVLRPHAERAAALAPEEPLVWPADLP